MENKIAGLFLFFLVSFKRTAKEEDKNMENSDSRIREDRNGSAHETTGRVCVCVCCHGQSRERKLDETKIRGLFFFCFFFFKISKMSVGLWLLFLRENRLRMEQQSGWK